jgi:F0F1-type ATP synthase delta subunit
MKKAVVTLITASKLTSQQKNTVMEALEQKLGSVEIEEVVDPTLIGGLKIKIGNQEFDASLSGKLERLETQVAEVIVTTAVELTSEQRKKLTAAIEEKMGTNRISEVIDPSIIGGIKIIAGSREIDSSVKGKLNKLKQQLSRTV